MEHADITLPRKELKRILHITGGMNRGGAETMIMNVYRSIDRSKIQFDFLVFTDKDCDYDQEIMDFGGHIYKLNPINPLRPLETVRLFTELLNKHGPFYAVHAHTLFNIGWVLLCARWVKIRIRIAHAHSTRDTLSDSLLRKLYQMVMRAMISSNATSIIACGREAGNYLFGRGFSRRGIVVPNAIDVESYQSVAQEVTETLRSKLKIEFDTIVIGQVGNFKRVKNHKHTLLLAKRLLELGFKFRVVFAGDGELRSEMESYVNECGLSEYVNFLGMRIDVPVVLSLMDIFVMPSLYEGLPVALIEAQAADLPCLVSTNVTREADLGTGLIEYLQLDDLPGWIDCILQLQKKTISRRAFCRIRRALIHQNYDVSANLNIYYRLYSLEVAEG